jgi:UDP-N-acetylmuramoylalanine--D-glutamate ligase
MNFKDRKCLILGLGKSGLSAALLLKQLGAHVKVSDSGSGKNIEKNVATLREQGIVDIEIGQHSEVLLNQCDLIVVSPAVSMSNPLLVKAHSKGITIISEIELGYLNSQAPIIAITGTNGKTTTSSLCAQLLDNAGYKTYLCGNIGNPFCDIALKTKKEDIIILEVSSFQLMTCRQFKPKVSMILNIDQDHLDYHSDFKEYYLAKARIFQNQEYDDFCILRQEDFKAYYHKLNIKPQVIKVSENLDADIYVRNKNIIRHNKNFTDISKINLPNVKAVENFLFLAAFCDAFAIADKILFQTINQFKGLSHRIEEVATYKGVCYIDDSKATNISATRQALKNMDGPVILIAGGLDKDTDFSKTNLDFFDNVKLIILTGEARHKLEKVLENIRPTKVIDDFRAAVIHAKEEAQAGDIVLLSPMCASFDRFSSYKERGRVFQDIVREINS